MSHTNRKSPTRSQEIFLIPSGAVAMFKIYLDLLSAFFLSADKHCRSYAAAYKEQSQPKEDVAVIAGLR